MIDYKPTLVSELNALGYPVYYELFVDSDTPTPCITYQETNDETISEANNDVRYSRKTFTLKVWGEDLGSQAAILSLLDSKMFHLGFTRTNYNELWFDDKLCMIVRYRGLFKE